MVAALLCCSVHKFLTCQWLNWQATGKLQLDRKQSRRWGGVCWG